LRAAFTITEPCAATIAAMQSANSLTLPQVAATLAVALVTHDTLGAPE
jgi:hypothetical protein